MDDKRYNKLDVPIQKILKKLALPSDKKRKNNERLRSLLENYLLPAMKQEDKIFKNIFKKINYSGSYYENLRIREANEFDLNLELQSQTKKEKFLQVSCDDCPPGFVQVRNLSRKHFQWWVNEDGYVLQRQVYYWLQGVVDKALQRITDVPWHKISRKTSGPAITLYVEYLCGETFSVDLVPVFVFGNNEWPSTPVRKLIQRSSFGEEWCVVPKSPATDHQNATTFWRISFYNQEKVFLNDKNHLKCIIKLLKLLRDNEGWVCLSSYYIKTVALWFLIENDQQLGRRGVGTLLIQMMRELKRNFKVKRAIPFFWDERHNLLSSVHSSEIDKIGNRLERILNEIDYHFVNNPDCINVFFKVNEDSSLQDINRAPVHFCGNESEENKADAVSLTTEQGSSVDWTKFTIGIGAIAVGCYYFVRNS